MEGFGNGDLVVEDVQVHVPKARDMIVAVNMGLKKRHFGRKIECATNGAYYMMDGNNKKVAVFKPAEEEYRGGDMRLRKGHKAVREVAAYLLDHPKQGEEEGFGRIPPTTLVQCFGFKADGRNEWTKGSLQMFVPNKAWHHLGTDDAFSLEDFQKMTLIHIRYGNMGGHKFNVLRTKEGTLIPVDHGECFPKSLHYRYDWTTWKQAAEPYLPEMVAYVEAIDVEKDLEILAANGINFEDEVLFIFKVQNLVLKEGVLGGYVPRDIGELMLTDTGLGNLAGLVHRCRCYNTTGDEQVLMEMIRGKTKGYLDVFRETRIERERLMMALKDNKKIEKATSSNVVVSQKIEEPEPEFEKAFTGLIIEHEPDTQAARPQPPKPVPGTRGEWGKRKPKNPPS